MDWEDGEGRATERLGPKDLVFTPTGRLHGFRNDGVEDAQVFMVVGSGKPGALDFAPA